MNYFFVIYQEVSCNCGRTSLFYSMVRVWEKEANAWSDWQRSVQILGLPPGSRDLGWPQAEAAWNRISVSSQRLKSGLGSDSPASCQLDQWPVSRPWLCRNEFPQRDGKSEAKRKGCVNRLTWGTQRGASGALLALWIPYIEHSVSVSFDQSSCFAWFRVQIWFISASSHVLLLPPRLSLPPSLTSFPPLPKC